jgi:hypothetical protein
LKVTESVVLGVDGIGGDGEEEDGDGDVVSE